MFNWRKPIMYILFYLSGSNVPRNLRLLRKLNKLPIEKQKKYQEDQLAQILLYAYNNVKYYKDVLSKAGVVKNGEVFLENFKNIPLLTKDIIRKEGHNLYSKEKRKGIYENTSGGSTGEPVRFLQDKYYWEMNGLAGKIFFQELLGKHLGEPEIDVWGSERDVLRNSFSFKERVINYLYNRKILNAFKYNDDKFNEFVKVINKTKPVSFWVYADSMEELSKFIIKNNKKVYSPKFIISTATTLIPEVRELIESVFDCPVYNQYGSREIGTTAIECELKDGFHGFFSLQYLELIDNEIVVTVLTNYAMPLIRYKIGDTAERAEKENCSCGKGFLVFNDITGRTVAHFKTKKGNIVYSMLIIRKFWFLDWVKKFQIIQKEIGLIVCKIVLSKKPIEQELEDLRKVIKKIMDDDCEVKFEFVDDILPTKSGKYLYTVNEME